MSNLFQLKGEHQRLLEMADADDGSEASFSEALTTSLSAGVEQIEEKMEATLYVAKSLEANAEACAAEAKRLSERAAQYRKQAQQCKTRVMDVMAELEIGKVKRPLMTFTRVKGRDVCQVVDAKAIPAKYLVEKVSINPDKAAILKALKAGEEVEGCGLAEGAASLRIS